MATMTKAQQSAQKKATEVRKGLGNHKAASATGVIMANESFDLSAFIERLGTTRSAVSEMRRRGLKLRRDGGRVRVLGSDYIAYLESLPEATLDDPVED